MYKKHKAPHPFPPPKWGRVWEGVVFFCLLYFVLSGSLWAETLDRIAAVVNQDVITASELDAAMAETKRDTKTRDSKMETARNEILDKLINDVLLKQEIAKAKITVEDDELLRAIQNILRQNRMTPDELQRELASKGTSYETYKRHVSDQIRMVKFTNQVIGQNVKLAERELRDYYDRNKDEFGGANFETVRDKIYDYLYDEKVGKELNTYLMKQRRKAYINIK